MAVLKTYNNSNIEQLGVCLIQIRHKDKGSRCRFFVLPGDSPELLEMHDIELLGLLKIMCEMVGDKQADSKFNS